MNQTSTFNIDTLLDGTLNDLADLPEFRPFPVGSHRATIKLESKKINNHPSIEVKLIAIETLELPAGSQETPLEKGAEGSVLYMLDNEIGQGKFKNLMATVAEKFGAKTNRELIADLQGCEVAVVTTLRMNKEKTKSYMDIVELVIL